MGLYYRDDTIELHHGPTLEVLTDLPDASIGACVTSPPYYGLRDYGTDPVAWPAVAYDLLPGGPNHLVRPQKASLGLEDSVEAFIGHLVAIFREVRRVLADDGTCWINIGDSYAGKANGGDSVGPSSRADRAVTIPKRKNTTAAAPYKSLLGIPARLQLALTADEWTVRNDVIWHKTNAMPESVGDRLSGRHEHLFLLTKGPRYWFNLAGIREPQETRGERHEGRSGYRDGHPSKGGVVTRALHPDGRNPGDVWAMPTQRFAAAHFAVMPPRLAERCIVAGCKPGGVVLDPFSGSGTTGMAAQRHGHRYLGVELSEKFLDMSMGTRFAQSGLHYDHQEA